MTSITRLLNKSNTTDIISGTGTSYSSGAYEFLLFWSIWVHPLLLVGILLFWSNWVHPLLLVGFLLFWSMSSPPVISRVLTLLEHMSSPLLLVGFLLFWRIWVHPLLLVEFLLFWSIWVHPLLLIGFLLFWSMSSPPVINRVLTLLDHMSSPPVISSPGPKVHVNYCHHLASVVCRLSSVNFSHFKLLLRNHLADWNRT
jgi:hypothetical protein